jgi:hypothetical protein
MRKRPRTRPSNTRRNALWEGEAPAEPRIRRLMEKTPEV